MNYGVIMWMDILSQIHVMGCILLKTIRFNIVIKSPNKTNAHTAILVVQYNSQTHLKNVQFRIKKTTTRGPI